MSAVNNPITAGLPLEDLRRRYRAIARLIGDSEHAGVSRETIDVARGWLQEDADAISKAEALTRSSDKKS